MADLSRIADQSLVKGCEKFINDQTIGLNISCITPTRNSISFPFAYEYIAL
jgi:hypothetical protein